jgi:hypothetical protein
VILCVCVGGGGVQMVSLFTANGCLERSSFGCVCTGAYVRVPVGDAQHLPALRARPGLPRRMGGGAIHAQRPQHIQQRLRT